MTHIKQRLSAVLIVFILTLSVPAAIGEYAHSRLSSVAFNAIKGYRHIIAGTIYIDNKEFDQAVAEFQTARWFFAQAKANLKDLDGIRWLLLWLPRAEPRMKAGETIVEISCLISASGEYMALGLKSAANNLDIAMFHLTSGANSTWLITIDFGYARMMFEKAFALTSEAISKSETRRSLTLWGQPIDHFLQEALTTIEALSSDLHYKVKNHSNLVDLIEYVIYGVYFMNLGIHSFHQASYANETGYFNHAQSNFTLAEQYFNGALVYLSQASFDAHSNEVAEHLLRLLSASKLAKQAAGHACLGNLSAAKQKMLSALQEYKDALTSLMNFYEGSKE